MPRTLSPYLVPLLLVACMPPTQPDPAAVATPSMEAPARTAVTDLDAFSTFIATRPTPDALRQRYPGLLLVMPGDISTRELRSDNSRYFAEIDAEGRVAGGRFQ